MSDPRPARPRLDLRSGTQRVFAHLLVSSLVVSVANFTRKSMVQSSPM